jgi:hypothetical protein
MSVWPDSRRREDAFESENPNVTNACQIRGGDFYDPARAPEIG